MTVSNDEQVLEESGPDIATVGEVTGESGAEDMLSLSEQLAAAQAEAARNLEGWQRSQAEFANARKRYEKQRVEAYSAAAAETAAKLLPIIDDFERALEAAPGNVRQDPWYEGVVLMHKKLATVLEDLDVESIAAVGEPFDPNYHEALLQEASREYPSGTVVREMRRGYRLGDRVIRPALVAVAE